MPLLTLEKVAEDLDVSVQTVRNLNRRGLLPFTYIPSESGGVRRQVTRKDGTSYTLVRQGSPRVDSEDLAKFKVRIREGTGGAPAAAAGGPTRPAAPRPGRRAKPKPPPGLVKLRRQQRQGKLLHFD